MEYAPKSRKIVKEDIRAALFENSQRKQPKKQEQNPASLATVDVPLETKKGKNIVRQRNKGMETTQDAPTPDGITDTAIAVEDETPVAEEYNHRAEFKKVQKEIARNMLNRAILNDDIALAFDQYNILREDKNKDTEDEKFQLYNLIKKIQLDEKKKYNEAVIKFPTEDPKRFVAARRKALIDESLGKYKEALDKNLSHIELPNEIQELEEDDLPKPTEVVPNTSISKKVVDTQREILPHAYHNALNRKDFLAAYDQLTIAKSIDKEKYVEYSTKMIAALNEEIEKLEKIIAEEKRKAKKSFVTKVFEKIKKREEKPKSMILATSEKKLQQFEELKKVI